MAKLTKREAKLHLEACELLRQDVLSIDDKWFVLEHWHEGAQHMNGLAGAFFTPLPLARDFIIEVNGQRIVDLCAGIGRLAFYAYHGRGYQPGEHPEVTCVEVNPEYVAVGRKLLPEATWVCADALNAATWRTAERYDMAIANPPFGAVRSDAPKARYTGAAFEYRLIDAASDYADDGVFLVPQMSAPFKLSGIRGHERTDHETPRRFTEQTGIALQENCGIDTAFHAGEWRDVAPTVEIVCCDFQEARERRRSPQGDMFATA